MEFKVYYINFIIQHHFIVALAFIILSTLILSLPAFVEKMDYPTFQDPQMGFSTRRTLLSNRLNTWLKLQEETRPSGVLTKDPETYLRHVHDRLNMRDFRIHRDKRQADNETTFPETTIEIGNTTTLEQAIKAFTKQLKAASAEVSGTATPSTPPSSHKPAYGSPSQNVFHGPNYDPHIKPYETFFCGAPDKKYAQIVISNGGQDLFNLENVKRLCQLENDVMDLKSSLDLCISNTQKTKTVVDTQCCRPWSLVNYIAALTNKEYCYNITQFDLDRVDRILRRCSKYFLVRNQDWACKLTNSCPDQDCLKNELIGDILFYITGPSFVPRDTMYGDLGKLEETVIFLPVSSGIATKPLYDELLELRTPLPIVAINFDIKSLIFNQYLLHDLWLVAGSFVFIVTCLWLYMRSLFLTLAAQLVSLFTLGFDYFGYVGVLEIDTFPFMNLLTIILCVGVGADQTFLFHEVFQKNKFDPANEGDLAKILSKTYEHTFDAILTSALTTAAAFWGATASNVIAITCFSIFAGTAIIVNFLIMLVWFPTMMVIWEIYFSKPWNLCDCWDRNVDQVHGFMINHSLVASEFWSRIITVWNRRKLILINLIFDYKKIWFGLLSAIGMASCVIVFIYPKLTLSTALDFQLLMSRHWFERYDLEYKNKFYFNKGDYDEYELQYTMPLRFVWGLKPVDNGRFFNPTDLGHLEFDDTFDMGHPDAQRWLRQFCYQLRQQPFFQPSVGVSLTNCYIDTLVRSMNTKCDEIPYRNPRPCCDMPSFPYDRSLFDFCILKEMTEIYRGPSDLTYPRGAGVFFSKEQLEKDIAKIKAVVVEYESNVPYRSSFQNMSIFYDTVEAWMENITATAPPEMQNGFFVSDTEFLDLQRELTRGTEFTLLGSMALATFVLIIYTLNPVISLFAILTIGFSIITTVAMLVLMGWVLNVLESVIISTAVGLSIDFSLHYCINYRLCPMNRSRGREDAAKYALAYFMGPSFMAGFTTATAGFFMMFSIVLPYYQLGLFMFLIMVNSWIYATFYLGSLFALFGVLQDRYQYSYRGIFRVITGGVVGGGGGGGGVSSINMESIPPMYHDPLGIPSSSNDAERISIIRCESPKLESPNDECYASTSNGAGSSGARFGEIALEIP